MPRPRIDTLVVGTDRLAVEVLAPLVRTYTVRLHEERPIALGERVALVIGETPAVPCTVAAQEGARVELVRGTSSI